jgi:hypothetical protein
MSPPIPRSDDVLKTVDPTRAVRIPGQIVRKYRGSLPQRKVARSSQVRQTLKQWGKRVRAPAVRSKELRLKAKLFAASDFDKIRKIHASRHAHAEIVRQKLTPDVMMAMIATSMSLMAYENLKVEYAGRLRAARTVTARYRVQQDWRKLEQAASQFFAKAGLRGVRARELDNMVRAMKARRTAYKALSDITATRKLGATKSLSSLNFVVGSITAVAQVEDAISFDYSIGGSITDLCSDPLTGSLTARASHGFTMRICVWYWCPTWRDPFRTCHGCLDVAGVSFNVDVNIGYQISCREMTAWGCGTVQACASALGVTQCAACTACVVGTAGISSSGTSGTCTYGYGLQLRTTCTLAGITIFSATTPLQISIAAPCPPA